MKIVFKGHSGNGTSFNRKCVESLTHDNLSTLTTLPTFSAYTQLDLNNNLILITQWDNRILSKGQEIFQLISYSHFYINDLKKLPEYDNLTDVIKFSFKQMREELKNMSAELPILNSVVSFEPLLLNDLVGKLYKILTLISNKEAA